MAIQSRQPEYVTIADAARRAGMTPNGLRYWIKRKDIETHNTPLGRVVLESSLDRFLKEREASNER